MRHLTLSLFYYLLQFVLGNSGDGYFERWALFLEEVSHNPNDVTFYLYNNPQNYSLEAGEELDTSNFTAVRNWPLIPNAPFKIIIHGFMKNYSCWIPQEIKDTYFERGIVANIIAVDWKKLAEPMSPSIKMMPYPENLDNIKITGKRIAQLITLLVQTRNVSLHQIHLIGYCLGALVAGEAGEEVENVLGKKIGRITGLNPAGPGFFPGVHGRFLKDTDAEFVDVIHTAVGDEGRLGPTAHADFYMNKAGYKPQPGCEGNSVCSHESAGSYWIQSIGHPEICACRRMKSCKCPPQGNGVPFGENAKPEYEGSFFLRMAPVELSA